MLILGSLLLLVDFYAFQGVKAALSGTSPAFAQAIYFLYWGITVFSIGSLLLYQFGNLDRWGRRLATFLFVGFFTNLISKVFMVLLVFIDDLQRGAVWVYQQAFGSPEAGEEVSEIARSPLLGQVGLVAASVPVVAISWGIISGAHDYRVRRRTIELPKLPKSFDGLRIAQISDIHSGSFWNRTAVKGGVEQLMNEKPDMVFFTGDLVNNHAEEMRDYVDIFGQIKAPEGVFSVMGNHDYGEYVAWPNAAAKAKNIQNVKHLHQAMGWDLLINENRLLKKGDDTLAILGVENWSAKMRFPKYGRLAEAYAGSEKADVKLLLSHDPTHWDAEVLPTYPDIDVMFSGHTHGAQFGVEIPGIKWSPAKYFYDQWADLYRSGEQYLYVNRGFGYIGYPGRIGIPPEITIIELKAA